MSLIQVAPPTTIGVCPSSQQDSSFQSVAPITKEVTHKGTQACACAPGSFEDKNGLHYVGIPDQP